MTSFAAHAAEVSRRQVLRTAGAGAAVAALLATGMRSASAREVMHHQTSGITEVSPAQFTLHQAMRALWEDHVTWTRLYIVAAASDSAATDATAQRLLRNQVEIGDAVKPVYGEEAGNALTTLLSDHILGAADLLAAAKAGNAAGVDEASQKWYANGDEIAAFLSAANPEFWPLADMQEMMKGHLDLTLEEAVAHLSGDWDADIAAYDKVRAEIHAMADMLSEGLIAQFPEMFA